MKKRKIFDMLLGIAIPVLICSYAVVYHINHNTNPELPNDPQDKLSEEELNILPLKEIFTLSKKSGFWDNVLPTYSSDDSKFSVNNNRMSFGFCAHAEEDLYFEYFNLRTDEGKLCRFSKGNISVVLDEIVNLIVYDSSNKRLMFLVCYDYERTDMFAYDIEKKTTHYIELPFPYIGGPQIWNNTLYFTGTNHGDEKSQYGESFFFKANLDGTKIKPLAKNITRCLVYDGGIIYVICEEDGYIQPTLFHSSHDFSDTKILLEDISVYYFVICGDILYYIGQKEPYQPKDYIWGWVEIETGQSGIFKGESPDALNANADGLYFTYDKPDGGVYLMNHTQVKKIADFGGEGIIIDGGYLYLKQCFLEEAEMHLYRYDPKTEEWLKII
jgi:hypothetical protein